MTDIGGIEGIAGMSSARLFIRRIYTFFYREILSDKKIVDERHHKRIHKRTSAKYSNIAHMLTEFRNCAHEIIAKELKGKNLEEIKLCDIRANIFLSGYDEREKGIILSLPYEFQVNMENHAKEKRLSFRQGEGATGYCFLTKNSIVTIIGEMCRLDKSKVELVHPHLKWIISFPILHRDKNSVLAVLNVDCIKEKFRKNLKDTDLKDILEKCKNDKKIMKHVKKIERKFQSLPWVRLQMVRVYPLPAWLRMVIIIFVGMVAFMALLMIP